MQIFARLSFFFQLFFSEKLKILQVGLVLTTILGAVSESISLAVTIPILLSMLTEDESMMSSSLVGIFSNVIESLTGATPTALLLLMVGLLLIVLKAILTLSSLSLSAILRAGVLHDSKTGLIGRIKSKTPHNDLVKEYSEGDFYSLFNEHTTKLVAGFHFFVQLLVMLVSGLVYGLCLLILVPSFAITAGLIIAVIFVPYGVLTRYARTLSTVKLKYSGRLTSDVVQLYRAREYLIGVSRIDIFDVDVSRNLASLVSAEKYSAFAYALAASMKEIVLLLVVGLSSFAFLGFLEGDAASLLLGFGILYRAMTSFLSSQQNYQKLSEVEASCKEVWEAVEGGSSVELSAIDVAESAKVWPLTSAPAPGISLRSLSLCFDGVGSVLSGIDADFSSGKLAVITGASGSGKSSLLRCMLGIEETYQGHILFNEKPADALKNQGLLRIGFVPQNPQVFERSIRWNITLSDDSSREFLDDDIWEALEKVSLSEFIKSLPGRLDTHLDSRTISLSGGQKQRLHIARELFLKSNVLLFDEPTSALDQKNVKGFSSLLSELSGASTCIVVTHDPQITKHADSTLSLEGGILQPIGSLEITHDV